MRCLLNQMNSPLRRIGKIKSAAIEELVIYAQPGPYLHVGLHSYKTWFPYISLHFTAILTNTLGLPEGGGASEAHVGESRQ